MTGAPLVFDADLSAEGAGAEGVGAEGAGADGAETAGVTLGGLTLILSFLIGAEADSAGLLGRRGGRSFKRLVGEGVTSLSFSAARFLARGLVSAEALRFAGRDVV
jgi:hypothetical protein